MNGIEKIYYALGELAYVVASSDGEVQIEEVNALHDLLVDELKKNNSSFEYSDIIFNVLNDEKLNPDLTYDLAVQELKDASNYLTDDLKKEIIYVLTKVAEAYNSFDENEYKVLDKIKVEIEKL